MHALRSDYASTQTAFLAGGDGTQMYGQLLGGLGLLDRLDVPTFMTLSCSMPTGLQQIISNGSVPRQRGPCPIPT